MPWIIFAGAALLLIAAGSSSSQPPAVQSEYRRIYRMIARALGWQAPPLIATTGVDNGASDGRQVLYNPQWLLGVLRALSFEKRCQAAALVYLFAHELAHHEHGDAFNRRDRGVDLEHRADYWAGVALQRLGFSRAEITCTLGVIGDACSLSHGCPGERLAAVESGHADSSWGRA